MTTYLSKLDRYSLQGSCSVGHHRLQGQSPDTGATWMKSQQKSMKIKCACKLLSSQEQIVMVYCFLQSAAEYIADIKMHKIICADQFTDLWLAWHLCRS